MSSIPEQHTILLVDDNKNDRELMMRAFQRVNSPYPLFCVNDGNEALSFLQGTDAYVDRTKYPLPALILMDLKMPNKDGFEVLKWLKMQPVLKRLVVAILTTSPREEDVDEAYDLGANCFFVKPATLEELTEIVKLFCRWIQFNRFPAAGLP